MDTDLLAQLIGQKHGVLEQLRQLSRRQTDLITQGDMSKLMTVLAAKETLLRQLQTIERQLDPFRNQDPEQRRWRSPQARQRCQQLADRCESLLGEILLVEKQSESAMIRRRDETAARLQGAHAASQARDAYTQPPTRRRGALDLTSEA